jgi:hypothetical protein
MSRPVRTPQAQFRSQVQAVAVAGAVLAVGAAAASYWMAAPDARALTLSREAGFFMLLGAGAGLGAAMLAGALAFVMRRARAGARESEDHDA